MDQIHHFHKYGDIKLVSREKTLLMAYTSRLSHVSLELDDQVYTAQEENPTDPVITFHHEWRCATLSLFLDMINVSEPQEPKSDLYNLCDLLCFCREYVIQEQLQKSVERSIIKEMTEQDQQWAVLTLPHQLKYEWVDRLYLAKIALESMTKEAFLKPMKFDNDLQAVKTVTIGAVLEYLPAKWQADLLRTFIYMDSLANHTNEWAVASYWKEVADEFDPEYE